MAVEVAGKVRFIVVAATVAVLRLAAARALVLVLAATVTLALVVTVTRTAPALSPIRAVTSTHGEKKNTEDSFKKVEKGKGGEEKKNDKKENNLNETWKGQHTTQKIANKAATE